MVAGDTAVLKCAGSWAGIFYGLDYNGYEGKDMREEIMNNNTPQAPQIMQRAQRTKVGCKCGSDMFHALMEPLTPEEKLKHEAKVVGLLCVRCKNHIPLR